MKNLLSFLAVCALTTTVQAQVDSAEVYYSKGVAEKNAKRFLVANQYLTKAIVLRPDFKDAYMQQGYTLLEMKKPDQAINNFAKVLEIEPANKFAIQELTTLYYNFRQFNKAVEYARKCQDCDNAQKVIGLSYYQQEDYPNAVRALSQALAKNPNDAEATYTMARSYLDMEEYKKAVPYYEKAVQLDGTRSTWIYELGLLYYNVNDYKNALANFRKAADAGYTQSNDFKENMGYASLYSGEYDKGEELLLAIWQRKPGATDILRDMAEILYQQKQYDRSLSYCQKLMEIDAKDGKALYQAGLNFQKKGQKDKGQKMCDMAIEMDPSLASLRKKQEMPGM